MVELVVELTFFYEKGKKKQRWAQRIHEKFIGIFQRPRIPGMNK